MPANQEIKRAFELADDAMQGAIAWLHYSLSLQRTANESALRADLPQTAIQITHRWIRQCRPADFIVPMNDCFEPYACRVALLAVVSAFERALSEFIRILSDEGKPVSPGEKYKPRLEWAFETSNAQNYPDSATRSRIPSDCADIEHARRIRNCYMHGNGKVNDLYRTEKSRLTWVLQIVESEWVRQGWILLKRDELLHIAMSHVELIHVLHYEVQLKFYGESRPYSYAEEQKALELHRILIGV